MTAALRLQALAALPLRAAHAAYLRYLIRSAEGDLAYMQHQIEHASRLPAQMAAHRDYISTLRVRIATECS